MNTIIVEGVIGIGKDTLRPRDNVSMLGSARCSVLVVIAILEHWTSLRKLSGFQ